MLCSEWPEAPGEPGTNQRSASTLKDVKVGTFNDRVIVRNPNPRLFVHNSKNSASKLKFRGFVGIKPIEGIVAKEISKCPDGLLSGFVADREEDLDLRIKALDHESVKVSSNPLHTAIFGNNMIGSNKIKPTCRLSTLLIRTDKRHSEC